VREAEESRDGAYLEPEGEVSKAEYEECQREVYRRRKVLYGLEETARAMPLRPEMVLVLYEAEEDSYRCRVFYKEPRPSWAPDSLGVRASREEIQALGHHENPTVRLVADKVDEFHDLRTRLVDEGSPAPQRRVFYASEL
jgi:hypothetical protein